MTEFKQEKPKWLYNIGAISDLENDRFLSSTELRKAIDTAESELRSRALNKYSVLAISTQSSAHFIVLLLASWKMGCSVFPISNHLPPSTLDKLLRQIGANLKITEREWSVLSFSNSPLPNEPGLVLTSSGTTNSFKLCYLSITRVLNRVGSLAQSVHLQPEDRSLTLLPLSFGHGLIGNTLYPLLSGLHTHLLPTSASTLPKRIQEVITENKITFVSGTPSLWGHLANHLSGQVSDSVRRVHVASERSPGSLPSTLKRMFPNAEVFNVYGLTELGSWVSGHPFEKNLTNRIGTGWGCDLSLSDRNEILLRANSLCDLIVEQGQTTTFCESDWYPTGDLGARLSDGTFEIIGRLKNVINRAGEKLNIEVLENMILASSPAISEVCVFALDSSSVGEEVYAAYTGELDKEVLTIALGDHFPAHMMPKEYFKMEFIPKTVRGKMDRDQVKSLAKRTFDDSHLE